MSTRVPAELAQAVDAWAVQLHATRAAVLRGLVEDAVDAGDPPVAPLTARELGDLEMARLRSITGS